MKSIFGKLSDKSKSRIVKICIFIITFIIGIIFGTKLRRPVRIIVLDGSVIV